MRHARQISSLSLLVRFILPKLESSRQLHTTLALQKSEFQRSRGGEDFGGSVRQKRVGSQLRASLCQELQNGPYRDELLGKCGFCIHMVRMSSDLRRADILWSAFGGRQKDAQKYLRMYMHRLRTAVFEGLELPFSPYLEFNEITPEEESKRRAFESAFEMIKSEN